MFPITKSNYFFQNRKLLGFNRLSATFLEHFLQMHFFQSSLLPLHSQQPYPNDGKQLDFSNIEDLELNFPARLGPDEGMMPRKEHR